MRLTNAHSDATEEQPTAGIGWCTRVRSEMSRLWRPRAFI